MAVAPDACATLCGWRLPCAFRLAALPPLPLYTTRDCHSTLFVCVLCSCVLCGGGGVCGRYSYSASGSVICHCHCPALRLSLSDCRLPTILVCSAFSFSYADCRIVSYIGMYVYTHDTRGRLLRLCTRPVSSWQLAPAPARRAPTRRGPAPHRRRIARSVWRLAALLLRAARLSCSCLICFMFVMFCFQCFIVHAVWWSIARRHFFCCLYVDLSRSRSRCAHAHQMLHAAYKISLHAPRHHGSTIDDMHRHQWRHSHSA
jgi:hypothetical protein